MQRARAAARSFGVAAVLRSIWYQGVVNSFTRAASAEWNCTSTR
jgi:hypothetical protein